MNKQNFFTTLASILSFGFVLFIGNPLLAQDVSQEYNDAMSEASEVADWDTDDNDLIDADAFGKMKDGAILINTARGPLVDEPALARVALGRDLLHVVDPRVDVRHRGRVDVGARVRVEDPLGHLAQQGADQPHDRPEGQRPCGPGDSGRAAPRWTSGGFIPTPREARAR